MNVEGVPRTSRDLSEVFDMQRQQIRVLIDGIVEAQKAKLEDQCRFLKEQTDMRLSVLEASIQGFSPMGEPTDSHDSTNKVVIASSLAVSHNSTLNDQSQSMKSLEETESKHSMHRSTGLDDLFQSLQEMNTFFAWLAMQIGISNTIAKIIVCLSKDRLPKIISSPAVRLVHSTAFNVASTILIILNTAFIWISADDMMQRAIQHWINTPTGVIPEGEPETASFLFLLVDYVFASMFTVELLVRLIAEQGHFIINPDNNLWNALDLIVVMSAWCELAIAYVDVTFLRLFRLLRVLRSLRIVRIMRAFRELRMILLSLLGSVAPLFWALVMLYLIMFVFAVVIQQGVTSFLGGTPGGDVATMDMINNFETISRTSLTLFASITGGEDWLNVQQQLQSINNFYAALYVIYVAVIVLGVMNVINGIFVECAIAKARSDDELAMLEETEKTHTRVKQLMKLFHDLDKDQSGNMTIAEWESFVAKKEAQTVLQMLDLDASKTKDIFRLIDLDGSGAIEIKEFVVGCMQLQGSAKMVDVETLLRSNKKLMVKCTEYFEQMEKQIVMTVRDKFVTVEEQLETIVKAVRSMRSHHDSPEVPHSNLIPHFLLRDKNR